MADSRCKVDAQAVAMVDAANMGRAARVFESRELMTGAAGSWHAVSLGWMRYRYRRPQPGGLPAARRRVTISDDGCGPPGKLKSGERERNAEPKRRRERA